MPADFATQSNPQEQTRPLEPSDRGLLALRILLVALIAALPLELLLRVEPWGLNVPLFAAIGVLALVLITRRSGGDPRTRAALGAILLVVSSIFVWRGESLLWMGAVFTMVATVALLLLPDGSWLRNGDPFGVPFRAAARMLQAITGPVRLLQSDVDWREARSHTPGALAHVRGLAWSIPVVLPFLVLFAGADPAFASLTLDLIDPDVASHLILWGVLAWLTAGWLGAAVLPWTNRLEVRARVSAREATWVLGVLSLAFAAFVAVQVRYFFGGGTLVSEVTGLTYAEYARRGFFELVTVAALLLVVLLLTDGLTRDADRPGVRRLRMLSVVLLALLAVILVSALQRMRLYVDEFGLTQLRFFTTAFMLWLVVVFAWFAATVLRGRRQRFLGGVYVAGVAAVMLLAAIDPIGRIATFNVERASAAGRFDAAHALELGPDAVPVLLAGLDRIPVAERCTLAVGLARQWRQDPSAAESGWRSWNRARGRAYAAMANEVSRIERMCGSLEPAGERR